MQVCPKCGSQNSDQALTCVACGGSLFADVLAAPAKPAEGDATGGVIPYKNPAALIAYYLGIASGLPLIGLPAGIAAFVLGIMGLRARKRNPVIKGSVHAGIGIGCGCFFSLLWSVVIVLIVLAALDAR
jgi:hypothetical protein